MGDDGADVQAVFQHGQHLVPGLEDLAAIDALDDQRLEHDAVPVDQRGRGGNAQHGDAPAHHHRADHLVEGRGISRHFQAYVEPLAHAKAGADRRQVLGGDVDRDHVGHPRRQVQPRLVHVGDDHVTRADMARDRGGHDADGPRAGDQHVLSDQRKAERGVHGIAKRVQDRADAVGHAVGQRHHVEGGQRQVFGKGAGDIDADAAGLGVQVELARPALAAGMADQVALSGTALAQGQAGDVAAQFDDLSGEFVADDHGRGDGAGGPFIPVPDMHVRPAGPAPLRGLS